MDEAIDLMLGQYRELASTWGRAQDKPALANDLFDRLHAIAKVLRDSPRGREGLEMLCEDADIAVRLVAASETLSWDSAGGLRTLSAMELDADAGLHAVSAEYTLRAYSAGTLDLDW